MSQNKYANHLINETSPYLLQHAHNPVDWFPWCQQALDLAMQKDMPILLSIGYSSCHWCHVMERESFENEKIARIMNENFINIKVDREERPDLDEVYMNAVQTMTGSGGWPMTVFLTPSLKPFYAGTYFPPSDMYGRPGFVTILTAISRFYKEKRDQVESHSDEVMSVLQQMSNPSPSDNPINNALLDNAYKQMISAYDAENGGFGNAPKFPQAMSLSFLMRQCLSELKAEALEIVENSLKKMAYGGIYDQLGGGFHRYSVDEKWLVPHFEKMLYDNALLSKTYLDAYQITRNELYARIASETLDYALREMYYPERGFYSAQDADSEGEEGKYYVWSIDEIEKILENEAQTFAEYYGVNRNGNLEDNKNILHIPNPRKDIQIDHERCRAILLNERQKRAKPGLDDKILTSWNALMISSMAFGYQVLGDQEYLDAACKTARFILGTMSSDGMLLRTYRNGIAKLNAYAEDYAFFINALIDLYETTYEIFWLQEALRLNSIFIKEFWDGEGFLSTARSSEKLIASSKSGYDGAMPSANSMAAMNLVRLSVMIGDRNLRRMAETIFRMFMDQIENYASGFAQMLCAIDFYIRTPKEIAIIGNANDITRAAQIIHSRYMPNRILVAFDSSMTPTDLEANMPLLNGRMQSDKSLKVYVCENHVCQLPITGLDALRDYSEVYDALI